MIDSRRLQGLLVATAVACFAAPFVAYPFVPRPSPAWTVLLLLWPTHILWLLAAWQIGRRGVRRGLVQCVSWTAGLLAAGAAFLGLTSLLACGLDAKGVWPLLFLPAGLLLLAVARALHGPLPSNSLPGRNPA